MRRLAIIAAACVAVVLIAGITMLGMSPPAPVQQVVHKDLPQSMFASAAPAAALPSIIPPGAVAGSGPALPAVTPARPAPAPLPQTTPAAVPVANPAH